MIDDSIRLLRDAPVDEARLAEVRRRVLAKVGSRRPSLVRWALAGAVSSVLLAAVLWPTTLKLNPPAIVWSAPVPPEWAFEPVLIEWADHSLAPVARSLEVSPQPEPETTVVAVHEGAAMVQIPTSNPDVVLYWLVDGGGD